MTSRLCENAFDARVLDDFATLEDRFYGVRSRAMGEPAPVGGDVRWNPG